MDACITDDEIAQLQRGGLPPEKALALRRHVIACATCLRLVGVILDTDAEASAANPVNAAELPWRPPTHFDDFEQVEWIARGAMGQVYRAFDVRLGRPVALKFISASAPSRELRERFAQEARNLAQLQHPNIAIAYQAGELAGRPYLVTEWVVGQRLDEVSAPLPWERVLRLALGLARGLAAAHRKGILHRDIKPSNILLQEGDEPKLLDFGLAKALDDVQAGLTSTEAGVRVGTPRYMAPEVYRGQPATRASDIYSLGLVLYELSAGARRPRPEDAGASVAPAGRGRPAAELSRADSKSSTELIPLTRRLPSLSPALAAIIDRCLRVDPALRFPSAEPLVEALERLAVAGSAAAPGGNPYRGLRSFEAEHRALFFGRGGDIRALIEQLRVEPQVLLAGDSGVGKSSLCRAGVVPRVLEGDLADGLDYTAVQLIPGRHPLQALCAALAPLSRMPEQALLAWARSDPTAPRRALADGLRPGQGALLLVDQTEELITLSDPTEAATLAQVLRDLSLHTPVLRMLLAVRTDFLSRLVTLLEGMDERLQRTIYFVRPLSRAAAREAIAGPARHLGVIIDAVVLQQAEALALEPGGLPLVQFAMAELWEARDPAAAQLTAQTLEDLGGLAGALARHADHVMDALPKAQQGAARQLLLQLVSESETRARRSEDELALPGADARAALQALVAGRLVLAGQLDGKPCYELTHEVLINSWPRLRRLLASDAGERAARERLRVAAVEWQRLGRDPGTLWGSRLLHEAEPLRALDLPPLDRSFLAASRRAALLRRLLAPLLISVPLITVPLMKWLQDALQTRGALRRAQALLEQGEAAERSALSPRLASYQAFDASGDHRDPRAQALWQQAAQRAEQADRSYREALAALDAAPGRRQVRDARARILCDRRGLLGWHGDEGQQRLLAEELERAGIQCGAAHSAVSLYNLSGEALHARVDVFQVGEDQLLHLRSRDDGAKLPQEPARQPALQLTVPASASYLLAIEYHGGVLRYPLLPEGHPRCSLRLRAQAAGATAAPALDPRDAGPPPCDGEIVLPAQIPTGMVYVPAGWTFIGSHTPAMVRRALNAPPIHPVLVASFLLGEHEVTIGEWLDFLDAHPGQEEAYAPQDHSGARDLRLERAAGVWRFTLVESTGRYQAVEGQEIAYRDSPGRRGGRWECFPMGGVTPVQIRAYLGWLDRTGRLPGARLCDEWEWVRAARGADRRTFPFGDDAPPELVNIDSSYQRRDFGPDEIGRHRHGDSPFGVWDLTGNAGEVVRRHGAAGQLLILGGSYYLDPFNARVDNRDPAEEGLSSNDQGVRVCAPFPLPRPAAPATASHRRRCT